MQNKMAVIIVRWNDNNVNTEVIVCQNIEEAIEEMKNAYITEIRNFDSVIWEDTYINGDLTYAQVSFGTLRTEIMIGSMK